MTKYYVGIDMKGEFWFKDPDLSIRHRIRGPTVLWYGNSHRCWHQNNELHRDNGPSVIFSDGSLIYCLRGVFYEKDEYDKILRSVG